MIFFALIATALIVAVVLFLLPPLWLGVPASAGSTDRKAANLAIFRDQLLELEHEKQEGTLAEGDFEQAKRELSRRLLEEVEPEAGGGKHGSHAPSRSLAMILLVLVPLLAVGGYAILGQPRALDPTQTAAAPKVTPAQIEGMVAKLAERLKANPDDAKGWVMLGRSYKAMGRYGEAAEAYGKAETLIAKDAALLVDYAETLALAGTTGLQGKPKKLIDQALKLDAENPNVLLLAGAAAMEGGNRKDAIRYWEKLLPLVEPGSEIEGMLKGSLEKLKQGKTPAP